MGTNKQLANMKVILQLIITYAVLRYRLNQVCFPRHSFTVERQSRRV